MNAHVAALTANARERVREYGGGFLGADRVCTMPRSGPSTVHGSAARVPWVMRFEASFRRALRAQMLDFRAAYDAALERWRARDRSVMFPEGSYFMRVFHRAFCFGPAAS